MLPNDATTIPWQSLLSIFLQTVDISLNSDPQKAILSHFTPYISKFSPSPCFREFDEDASGARHRSCKEQKKCGRL
jgi:hypothetical protein